MAPPSVTDLNDQWVLILYGRFRLQFSLSFCQNQAGIKGGKTMPDRELWVKYGKTPWSAGHEGEELVVNLISSVSQNAFTFRPVIPSTSLRTVHRGNHF